MHAGRNEHERNLEPFRCIKQGTWLVSNITGAIHERVLGNQGTKRDVSFIKSLLKILLTRDRVELSTIVFMSWIVSDLKQA
jgi:hypothetical protein